MRRLKREMGREVDYGHERPAEDFARGTLVLEDPDGNEAMIETTTSWAYVGAGGSASSSSLLGPEYSMEFSSLGTGLKVFISRAVKGCRRRRPGGEAERRAGPSCRRLRTRPASTATPASAPSVLTY